MRSWIVLLCMLPGAPAAAQVVVLHSFTGGATDGQNPDGALTQFGSTFYSMTSAGGVFGDGTVFNINADGTAFALLHSFSGGLSDGRNPTGSPAIAGSTFYGMSLAGGNGGNGAVFKFNADGTGYSLVHSFFGGAADGSSPLGSPVLSGSTLYGMTSQGGTANLGTVFKTNADGTAFSVLHSFTGAPGDGHFPSFSALLISGSSIYGMTAEGGSADQGAIFRMNTDGTGFSVMHSFVPATGDGWDPNGSLILSGSTLYGMTRQGGGGAGTIFEINTDGGGYSRMHTFAGGPGDGANPVGTLLLVGSTLYGTTPNGGADALGTLFGINTDSTGYGVIHSFTGGPNDGANPGDLVSSGSTLYGITGAGGSNNLGTVFSITPVPEPSSLVLLAAAGSAAAIARWRSKRKSPRNPGTTGDRDSLVA
jgi:uncharacterized repeat protein (TIGR03803 family)